MLYYIVREIDTPRQICGEDRRSSAELTNASIIVERSRDAVAHEENYGGTEKV